MFGKKKVTEEEPIVVEKKPLDLIEKVELMAGGGAVATTYRPGVNGIKDIWHDCQRFISHDIIILYDDKRIVRLRNLPLRITERRFTPEEYEARFK